MYSHSPSHPLDLRLLFSTGPVNCCNLVTTPCRGLKESLSTNFLKVELLQYNFPKIHLKCLITLGVTRYPEPIGLELEVPTFLTSQRACQGKGTWPAPQLAVVIQKQSPELLNLKLETPLLL